MVGEIRDLETAEIAVKAAQTGHLVLSTLHTNDAPQTLTRLANMGIPAVQHRLLGQPDHGPAPGPPPVRTLQNGRRTAARRPDRRGLQRRRGRARASASSARSVATSAPRATRAASACSRSCRSATPWANSSWKAATLSRSATWRKPKACRTCAPPAWRRSRQGVTSLEEINRVTKD